VSDSKSLAAGPAAAGLPSDLASCLRAVTAAGQDHEPFAVQLLSRSELISLEGCGLIERGPSARSAVGDTGYRLTRRGWEVVALLWYDRGPAAREAAPVIRAS
jgi:hypothetical protein